MTTTRELVPAERMADVFDRASTMNFTTVVTVRGPLDEKALENALRAVERRHPLLRARIDRRFGLRFVLGQGAPMTLRWLDAPKEDIERFAAETLTHRTWPDDGPRGEVTVLKHALGHASILVTLHHVVSDGSSGVIVVRDILRALAGTLPEGSVDSPGQNAFFPEGRGGAKDLARSISAIARASSVRPFRIKPEKVVAPSERRVRVHAIDLDVDASSRLLARARRARSTAHGVLVGALARAVAAEGAGHRPMRIMHPVDFRRMLDGKSERPPIGDAVGYYVSAVETDVVVDGDSLDVLAGSITKDVHARKAAGEPFLSAPSAGKLVTFLGNLGTDRFRVSAERSLLINAFALTNLGPLEALGLTREVGGLTVLRAHFVAASSVMSALGASASSFGGAISLRIMMCEPALPEAMQTRILEAVRKDLAAFTAPE